MRLIDADVLLKSLESNIYPEKYGNPCNPMDVIHGVLQVIDEQPTAYDVDKVLEQLEELANEHLYRVTGEPDTYSEYNEAWQDCVDGAIDIVKEGGIDETNNQN